MHEQSSPSADRKRSWSQLQSHSKHPCITAGKLVLPTAPLMWKSWFQRTVTLNQEPVWFHSHWSSSLMVSSASRQEGTCSLGFYWLLYSTKTLPQNNEGIDTSHLLHLILYNRTPSHPSTSLTTVTLSYLITPIFLIYKYVSPQTQTQRRGVDALTPGSLTVYALKHMLCYKKNQKPNWATEIHE